jgi:UDP-2-acetamido-2-deoxy-ribo-hexuluronate aminotransferase
VITTPFTFFATGEMITLLGARPVFVDVEPVGYNLDPEKIEAAITPRTRAILPVSLYGQTADMDAINAIAERHGLAVIEDAAQSFGALYKGGHSGNLSTIGCTSFFPSKPLGCYGDWRGVFHERRCAGRGFAGAAESWTGGAVPAYADRDQRAAGYAAGGGVFDEELTARGEIAGRYNALLKDAVHTPQVLPERTSVWAQYTIEVEDRAGVESSLKGAGIPTAVHYPVPLHVQPVYAGLGWGRGSFPVAERAAERVLSLPMHPYLKPAELERVADAVKAAVRGPVGASAEQLGR